MGEGFGFCFVFLLLSSNRSVNPSSMLMQTVWKGVLGSKPSTCPGSREGGISQFIDWRYMLSLHSLLGAVLTSFLQSGPTALQPS